MVNMTIHMLYGKHDHTCYMVNTKYDIHMLYSKYDIHKLYGKHDHTYVIW